MRTETFTVTRNLYHFNELSDEAKDHCMKLIDYCRSVDFVDFDSYDNVYDVIVTICFDEEAVDKPEDSYDRFVKYIVEHVDYIKGNGNYVICDWNGFVKAHEQVLRQYEHDCWRYNYDEDEDEFNADDIFKGL